MFDTFTLAAFLAFQAPAICLIICSYVFVCISRNGLSHRETVLLRIMAASCIAEMTLELISGLQVYGLINYNSGSVIYLSDAAYLFMSLNTAAFTEFCISRINSPSKAHCRVLRVFYAVCLAVLLVRIFAGNSALFTYIEQDSTAVYGPLDDAQTWCCFIIGVLRTVMIIKAFSDKNEYASHEEYGKLLAASLIITFIFLTYLLFYIPYIIYLGYMFIILFLFISNQGLLIYRDELTSLNNRRSMLKDLEDYESSDLPWTYMLLDVNRFKQINDEFGHNQGDAALKKIARVLDNAASNNGAAAYRLGGDEFAFIVPSDDEAFINSVCDEINSNLRETADKDSLPFELAVSIGYSTYGSEGIYDIPEIMELADKKMYENKRQIKAATA